MEEKVKVIPLAEGEKICRYCNETKLQKLAQSEEKKIALEFKSKRGLYMCTKCKKLFRVSVRIVNFDVSVWTEYLEAVKSSEIQDLNVLGQVKGHNYTSACELI